MLKKERPILPNLLKEGTFEIEKFQNQVVRPIIKMQHSLFIFLFKNYLSKKKIAFNSFSEKEKNEKIKQIFTKDLAFKNTILGAVLGHFSNDELRFYVKNTSEINKRILQITVQRLQDLPEEL